jgi:hypothetical protein
MKSNVKLFTNQTAIVDVTITTHWSGRQYISGKASALHNVFLNERAPEDIFNHVYRIAGWHSVDLKKIQVILTSSLSNKGMLSPPRYRPFLLLLNKTVHSLERQLNTRNLIYLLVTYNTSAEIGANIYLCEQPCCHIISQYLVSHV